jgi:hypothetical protein
MFRRQARTKFTADPAIATVMAHAEMTVNAPEPTSNDWPRLVPSVV